jgi:hypothetical protein
VFIGEGMGGGAGSTGATRRQAGGLGRLLHLRAARKAKDEQERADGKPAQPHRHRHP